MLLNSPIDKTTMGAPGAGICSPRRRIERHSKLLEPEDVARLKLMGIGEDLVHHAIMHYLQRFRVRHGLS